MNRMDDLSDSEDEDLSVERAQGHGGPSPETLTNIATLKASLEANPNQYEQHAQLITLLKNEAMLVELRSARESMHAIFPLSEDMWLDWIRDESAMATSKEEKEHVLELYIRATTDYLYIPIWKSYVEFMVQEYTESQEFSGGEFIVTKEQVQATFRKADKFTGHHIAQSHVIWNAWVAFECLSLDAEQSDQVKRIQEMYMSRIGVPHSDLDNTLSGLSSFTTQYDSQGYENVMVRGSGIAGVTRKLLAERDIFEQELISTANSLPAFLKYLDFELQGNKKQFALVRTLFERALAVHCLVPTIWNDYVTFLIKMSSLKKECDLDPHELLSVAARSVRNCPWTGDLWENEILFLELYSKPEDRINDIFAKALSNVNLLSNPQEVVKVILAYCSHKHREAAAGDDGRDAVRAAFQHALTVAEAAGGDPTFRTEMLWIELEAFKFDNAKEARRMWEGIIKKQKTLSDSWIAFADFERRLGNPKGARHVYSRACGSAAHVDWPEKIFEAWLAFERSNGTVVQYKDALVKTRHELKTVEKVRAEVAYVPTPVEWVAPTDSHAEKPQVSLKRKLSADDGSERESKVSKLAEASGDRIATSATSASPLDISAGRHDDTCFFNNFPASMTTDTLKSLFEQYGTLLRFTVPIKHGGKRTFGYAQFSSPAEANAALALDGHDVGDQRGLAVKISDTSQRFNRGGGTAPPKPKVSHHELTITGLTNDMTQQELEKLVALHATPSSVFIFRKSDENGERRANVKFSSEADADAALKLHGTVYHGETLHVSRRTFSQADSDKFGKPKDKRKEVPSRAEAPARPMASLTSMAPRVVKPAAPLPRPAASLVPRRTAFQPAKATSSSHSQGQTQVLSTDSKVVDGSSESSVASTPAPPPAQRSNADFRAMFLSGQLKKKNDP